MSNLNNTTALVSTESAFAPAFLNVDVKPEGEIKAKAMPYGVFAMREIVKGLRATEKGNRGNVVFHVGQVIETIARIMRDDRTNDTNSFGETKEGQPFPSGVKSALNDTFREVQVAMVKAGDAPFLNCGTSVARIKAMPKGTEQQRKLWDYQARKLVDSTLFLNGQAVAKPKSKFLPQELRDAKSKELVESLKVLRNYTNKIVGFIWHEHGDVIREFAFREEDGAPFRAFDEADVESIAALVERKAPGGMSDLAHAFRNKAKPANEDSAVVKMMKSFEKLSFEEQGEFLKLAQAGYASKVSAKAHATKAVNGDEAESTDGADADDFADLREGNDNDGKVVSEGSESAAA